jgi:hypothetical protein
MSELTFGSDLALFAWTVPPSPTLNKLMGTLCSAVELLVELTVEGRALLGPRYFVMTFLGLKLFRNKALKNDVHVFKAPIGKAGLLFTRRFRLA